MSDDEQNSGKGRTDKADGHEKRLSDRKKVILKAVIDAHIDNGEPVGSKFLMTNKQIALSSATIRNEMAELEEMGYLEQPHTSSGRIPSELGYRFYVDSLMESYRLNASDLAVLNRLISNRAAALDKLIERASKVMASLTNYTSLSVRPKPNRVVVLRFKTVLLDSLNFLLVMITSANIVNTKNIRSGIEIGEQMMETLEAVLNRFLVGAELDQITLPVIMEMENAAGDAAPFISPVIKCIYEVVSEISDELNFEGVNKLLQYPEYADVELLRGMLGLFEKKEDIVKMVSSGDKNGTNIYIGSENIVDVMHNSSIVFKTIKAKGRPVGAIGVIGPCRMDYSKVVTTVEYLADKIAAMADETNGGEGQTPTDKAGGLLDSPRNPAYGGDKKGE